MDQTNDLSSWRALLACLETAELKPEIDCFAKLEVLLSHLPPSVPPRLQKDYESCTLRSTKIFEQLFDKIDLSDKPLLCSFLQMLKSFGFFRISQMTFHTGLPAEELEAHPIYSPAIEKSKWYDMEPILPGAGTIGWKSIMNHGLVREEQQLSTICLQLLTLKLHFLAIVSRLDYFQNSGEIIDKNGKKVVEKLFELMRDAAYDDDCMIGMNNQLFNLMSIFSNEERQSAIVDAIVQDLFKPYTLQKEIQDESSTYDCIGDCIMNRVSLQNVLFSKLIDHMKCNIIRRKRRHSVEANLEDKVPLESILDDINNRRKFSEILCNLESIELNSKSLQIKYIEFWALVIGRIISRQTTLASNSQKIISTCSVLLITASDLLGSDLINSLSSLLAKSIETTTDANVDKLLYLCDPTSILKFAQMLASKSDKFTSFDSPVQQFIKNYLNRYLAISIIRGNEKRAKEFSSTFVDSICDKSLDKDLSHQMQYICLQELARCLGNATNRRGSQVYSIFLNCSKICSKRMLRFIKKHSPLKSNQSNGCKDKMDYEDLNDSIESATIVPERMVTINALVCILIVAIENNEKEVLDEYSDFLLKLFDYMTRRAETLFDGVRNGLPADVCPIDSHLPRLFHLYRTHKDMIAGYLNYHFFERITPLPIHELENECSNWDLLKARKKNVYNQVKQKLESLEERANKSADVYPTIINKQYSYVTGQSINDYKDESLPCCRKYLNQMKTVQKLVSVVFTASNLNENLRNTVKLLENCDPLDHPNVLYLFLILESLIPHNINSFSDHGLRISNSLMRIVKSVELGPSIHAFTKAGRHKSNASIKCCTYASAARIYTSLIIHHPKLFESLKTDAMEICVASNLIEYAKCKKLDLFVQLGSTLGQLLRTLSNSEHASFQSSLPVFLSIFSLMIRCLIIISDQSVPSLESLAIDIGRIFKNLGDRRVDLVAFAPYIITNYVKDIQQAPCTGRIRRQLDEGIFRIFNLVDAHQLQRKEKVIESGQRKTIAGRATGSIFELVHSRLDQAGREVFRELHDDYNRFYRYQAKC